MYGAASASAAIIARAALWLRGWPRSTSWSPTTSASSEATASRTRPGSTRPSDRDLPFMMLNVANRILRLPPVLPRAGLVQQDRGRHRDVEGVAGAQHRDRHAAVASVVPGVGDAVALAADGQRGAAGGVGLPVADRRVGVGGR